MHLGASARFARPAPVAVLPNRKRALLARIEAVFPKHAPEIGLLAADDAVEKGQAINRALRGPWWEVPLGEAAACGDLDALVHVTGPGLRYYLPALMACSLRLRRLVWLEDALLPLEDEADARAADFFTFGTLRRMDTCCETRGCGPRVHFVRRQLSGGQREAVHAYLEFVLRQSHTAAYPADEEFERHLATVLDFWSPA